MTPRRALVVGASRGLGLAVTERLLRDGWTVYAGMRTPDGSALNHPRCTPVALDLRSSWSLEAAVQQVEELLAGGSLDALVLNAGVTAMGAFEDTPVDAFEEIFSTNLFGPMALTRLCIPLLRPGGGRIVVVSSVVASSALPWVSAYAASKAALARWAECLGHEVCEFGMHVTVVEPGSHRTSIVTDAPRYVDPQGHYTGRANGAERLNRVADRVAASPARFARVVARILGSPHPPSWRPVGADAWLLAGLRRILPQRAITYLVRLG